MSEEITLKIKKENLWKYSTFILLAIVVIGVIVMIAGDGSNNNNTQVTTGNQQADYVSVDFEQVIDSQTPVAGSEDAPVTVIEFMDFSCPWCAAASGHNEQYTGLAKQQIGSSWEPIVSNLMKDYVETGKVRLVVKFTPGHSGGHPAQTVAWCLNEQSSGLYWEFYADAFANIDDVEDAAKMRALAQKITGVNMQKLDSCISSKKFESRFDEEQAQAAALGVSGTPGFLVGKSDGSDQASVVRGADSYNNFRQLVEARL